MNYIFYLRIVPILFSFFLHSAEEAREKQVAMPQRLASRVVQFDETGFVNAKCVRLPRRFAAFAVIRRESKQGRVDPALMSYIENKIKGNEALGLFEISNFLSAKIAVNDSGTDQEILEAALQADREWRKQYADRLLTRFASLAVLLKEDADGKKVCQELMSDIVAKMKKGVEKLGIFEISDLLSSKIGASGTDQAILEAALQADREWRKQYADQLPIRFAALAVLLKAEAEGKKVCRSLLDALVNQLVKAREAKAYDDKKSRSQKTLPVCNLSRVGRHGVETLLKSEQQKGDIDTDREILEAALEADREWLKSFQKRRLGIDRKYMNSKKGNAQSGSSDPEVGMKVDGIVLCSLLLGVFDRSEADSNTPLRRKRTVSVVENQEKSAPASKRI